MTSTYVIAFMSFGMGELIVIGTVALLVFGGQLPDVMRSMGRAYGKFKAALHEVSAPVRDEIRQVRDMPTPTDEIRRVADEAANMNPASGGDTIDADRPPSDAEYSTPPAGPVESDEGGLSAPWPSSGAPADTEPSAPPTFAGDDDDEPLPP